MRFASLFALAAAASAVFASNLGEQIGTVPAFLQLQKQHYDNALSPELRTEFIKLAQKIHSQSPKSLTLLAGSSNEAQQLVNDLIDGDISAVKRSSADAQAEHTVGSVPTFISLNQAAAQPNASEEDIQALIKQGVTMLGEGYNERDLRLMLGTSEQGNDLLSKIAAQKN